MLHCRWCNKKSSTSQGIAAHEKGKHTSEYYEARNGSGPKKKSGVIDISDDPVGHLAQAMQSLLDRRARLREELDRQSHLEKELQGVGEKIDALARAQEVFKQSEPSSV